MKKLFTLLLSIITFLNVSAQDDFANELYFLTDQAPNSQDNYGNDVVVHGNLLFVAAPYDDIQASNNGSVSLYSRANASAPWVFVKRILPADVKIDAFLGESIAVDGDYLVVGAEGWGPNAVTKHGSVYVFHRNAGGTDNWGQVKKIDPSTIVNGADFGKSVDIDGDKIIVGAPGQKRAYLYQKDAGGVDNWGEIKIFSDATSTRNFGESVVVKDGLAMMGGGWYASGYTSNVGQVKIYSQNEGGVNNWGLIKTLGQSRNTFGKTMDYDGTTLAINATRYTGTGSSTAPGNCFVFSKDLGGVNNFGLVKMISANNLALLDFFALRVSVDGDNIVVGALDNSISYKAYLYKKDKGGVNNWGQDAILLNTDGTSTDNFGRAIDIAGEEIMIGASTSIFGGAAVGKMYGFHLDSCFTRHTIINDTILYESSYFFKNQFLTKDGQYKDTLQSIAGCDSIVILNLYVDSRINFEDQWDFAAGNGTYDVAIGDLTGDGKADMVSANYLGNSISLFWNIGTTGVINPSTFFPSIEVPVGSGITGVEIVDITGDGINDIVVSSYSDDKVYVFKNIYTSGMLNAASFDAPVAFTAGNGPFDIEAEDLDGNGKIDIIVLNKLDRSVSVFPNFSFSNTPFLATKLDYTLGSAYGNALAFGDMNNDNKTDILVTVDIGDVLYGFQNNGVVGGISFLPRTTVSFNGGNPGSAQVFDMNGDGCEDIFQAHYISGYKASTYKNNCLTGNLSSTNFTFSSFYNLLATNTSAVYGMNTRRADLDQNGKEDVVVNDQISGTPNGRFYAMANINDLDNTLNGNDFNTKYNKTFTTNYTNLIGSTSWDYPINLRLGDIDGDGLEDLAMINYGDDKVMVFKNSSIVSTLQTDTLASASGNGTVFCTSDSIQLSLSTNATFLNGNHFIVQVSDITGSFSNPTTVLNLASTSSGPIMAPMPSNVVAGTGYKYRVISTQPYIVSDPTAALTIQNALTSYISQSICAGDSVFFGNQYIDQPGVYSSSTPTSTGCDSTTVLTLSFSSSTQFSFADTICQGDSYTFGSQVLTVAGIYSDTINNPSGCDSIVVLTLSVRPNTTASVTAAICQGNSYTFGTQTLTTAGTYTRTMTNSVGCDSVITLNLSIKPNTASSITTSICQGTSYTFGTQTLTTAGTYTRTLTNSVGCDSVITLNLSIKPNTASSVTAAICQGTSYTFGTQTITTAGTYTRTLTNSVGCDSVITLNLSIKPNTASSVTAAICQGASYTFGTQTLTTAGTYTRTLANSVGCDSVITLNLSIKPNTASSVTAAICQGASYTFGTQTITTAGTYTRTLVNSVGCDSVITLNLSIKPNTASSVTAAICQGASYTFGTQTITTAGIYTRTMTNSVGCDSVITLNLTIKPNTASSVTAAICQGASYTFGTQTITAAGTYTRTLVNSVGCDSVITLNLSIKPNTDSSVTTAICQGSSYTFGTQTITMAGTYTRTLTNSVGCDSVITLNLSIKPNTVSSVTAAICQGSSYTFGTQTITTAGTYTRTLVNSVGCDSVITLNLSIKPNTASSVTAAICQGASYTFGTQTITMAGTYTRTLVNSVGCDSVITLNLSIKPNTASSVTAAICQGSSYTFGTQTITMAGTYTRTLTNSVGCDSVITLNLSIKPNTASSVTAAICQGASYTFGTQTITTAGTYTRTLTNSVGCDSVITLNLSIKPNTASSVTAAICQGTSYTFGTQTITTAGTYTRTLVNSVGCDSVITLNLSIKPNTASSVTAAICQGASYTFGTQTITTAGTYTRTLVNSVGCDSVITLNLSIKPNTASSVTAAICQGASYTFGTQTITAAGTYTRTLVNSVGCDSVITLNLSIKPNTVSSVTAAICQGASYTFGTQTITTAGTYTRTLTNSVGCDSVITLNLSIKPNTASSVTAAICQGTSYTFGTQTITTAGTYTRTMTNSVGCDSVITLNLSIKPNTASSVTAAICQGSSYTFGTQTITTAGTYTRTLVNSVGCDSVITLNLSIKPNTASSVTAAICQGASYTFGTQTITTAGTYTRTLTNSVGCDSVITLNLSIKPNTASSVTAAICQGASYTFGTQTITAAGTYTRTLVNSVGCDSVITLNLTVNPTSASSINATICQGATYSFAGQTLSSSGIYLDTLANSLGCDSIVTLNLTVNPTSASSINATICQGATYSFAGQTLSSSGIYLDTLANSLGCDSIVTLNLTVNPTSANSINATICQGATYSFAGQTLSNSGIYLDTLANSLGCDSVITLNLTVNPTSASSINATICQGATYSFAGQTLSSSGIYLDTLANSLGCDSIVTLNLSVDTLVVIANSNTLTIPAGDSLFVSVNNLSNALSYTWQFGNGDSSNALLDTVIYNTPGNYTIVLTGTNANGCVSTDTLQILVENGIGVEHFANLHNIKMFPNPATNHVNLSFDFNQTEQLDIIIMDALGQQLHRQSLSIMQGQISLNTANYAPGMYIVRVRQANQEKVFKLIKD